MKKILILTLVLMLLFTIGCIPKREEMSPMEEISNAEKLLKGEHILRKVYSSEENQTNSKGFFLYSLVVITVKKNQRWLFNLPGK